MPANLLVGFPVMIRLRPFTKGYGRLHNYALSLCLGAGNARQIVGGSSCSQGQRRILCRPLLIVVSATKKNKQQHGKTPANILIVNGQIVARPFSGAFLILKTNNSCHFYFRPPPGSFTTKNLGGELPGEMCLFQFAKRHNYRQHSPPREPHNPITSSGLGNARPTNGNDCQIHCN